MRDILIGRKNVRSLTPSSYEWKNYSRFKYPDLRVWSCAKSTRMHASVLMASSNTFLIMMIAKMDTTPHENTSGMSSSPSKLHMSKQESATWSSGTRGIKGMGLKQPSLSDQTYTTPSKTTIWYAVSRDKFRHQRLSFENAVGRVWIQEAKASKESRAVRCWVDSRLGGSYSWGWYHWWCELIECSIAIRSRSRRSENDCWRV